MWFPAATLTIAWFTPFTSGYGGEVLPKHILEEFIGAKARYVLILFTMMIPFQIVLIPQYILMVKLGWTDTYLSLIAPTMMSAFGIVLFRQFFMAIPQALIDAARIDGCTELGILFRVIWPLSRPVVLTVGLLTFMTSWNEVLWPLIVIKDPAMRDWVANVATTVVAGRVLIASISFRFFQLQRM